MLMVMTARAGADRRCAWDGRVHSVDGVGLKTFAEVIRRWLETLLSLVVTLIGDEICIGYPLLVSGEYHSLSDTNTMMLLMLAELSL